jgi:hypothetical protein
MADLFGDATFRAPAPQFTQTKPASAVYQKS